MNLTMSIMFGGMKVGVRLSSMVAGFSSWRPNLMMPEILMQQINAVGPRGYWWTCRGWNLGSSPRPPCRIPVSAALPPSSKGAHLNWSSTAIRSVLKTTIYSAYPSGDGFLDVATGKAATPFNYGTGHINPPRATEPSTAKLLKDSFFGGMDDDKTPAPPILLVAEHGSSSSTDISDLMDYFLILYSRLF
ncbi:hypothetical protein COCNU_scaffold016272G000010 [Cocos nucifera]|nr:hypothetical protein [Cocos nucifera]